MNGWFRFLYVIMIEVTVDAANSRQRADKFIIRSLPGASKSLIYKQIRKKNITLNGTKMNGSEILETGDKLQFYFSDETYQKFKADVDLSIFDEVIELASRAYDSDIKGIEVIYEDDNIILMNKPSGVLSQSAAGNEISLNEWLLGYLLDTKAINRLTLTNFKPSVLNRLDRNTSGIVIGSKSLLGANVISSMLKDRSLHKYYLTYVTGNFNEDTTLSGYHHKDQLSNMATIKQELEPNDNPADFDRILTRFTPVRHITNNRLGDITLLEVKLITGKSHQIRAHLASIGNPILGDHKYGDKKVNHSLFSLNIHNQMLHAYKLVMPDKMPDGMENLEGRVYTCNPPKEWSKIDGNLEE